MKLRHLLALSLFVLVMACNKEDDDAIGANDFFIEFRKDNALIRYTASEANNEKFVLGSHNILNSAGTLYASSASGQLEAHEISKNMASLVVAHPQPIEVNRVYTADEQGVPGAIIPELFILSYADETGTFHQSTSAHHISGLPTNGRLQFTEINDKYMSGTFSGIYYNNDDMSEHFTVTDGKFKVRRHQ